MNDDKVGSVSKVTTLELMMMVGSSTAKPLTSLRDVNWILDGSDPKIRCKMAFLSLISTIDGVFCHQIYFGPIKSFCPLACQFWSHPRWVLTAQKIYENWN